jgi:adenylate cyclase
MRTPEIILLTTLVAGSTFLSASAQSTLPKAQQDSLWAVWNDPAQADTSRLKALFKSAYYGYLSSQPDSAWHYAQLQYDFAAEKGLQKYMGSALGLQGSIFVNRGDYAKALDHFQKSMNICESIGDKTGIAATLNNTGMIYCDQGDLLKCMDYFKRSLKLYEELGNKPCIANLLNNIGSIYGEQGEYPKAVFHFQKAMLIYEEVGDRNGLAISLNNIGSIYREEGDLNEALDFSERSLKIQEEIGDRSKISNSLVNIGMVYAQLNDHLKALDHFQRSLKVSEAIDNKRLMAMAYVSLAGLDHQKKNYKGALAWCEKSLMLAVEMGAINQQKIACQCLYDASKAMGRDKEALVYLEKIGELDKQLNKEETAMKLQQMEFKQVMLQDSITKAEETRLLHEAHQEEVLRTTRTRNVLAVSGSFLLMLAVGFYGRARYMRRSRAVLQVEKDRSESLLLNILPAEIAEELKQKGRCEARDFDTVSILFTDFKDFTEHSAAMSAAALVNEINHCFEAFDGIMAKYGIEKIKTIGDAYMAAGGLPVPTEGSVKNTVLAALEMQKFIRERKVQKDALGEPAFEMRVGIHTGPVVAGIVGVKKFQYDIWGDTVNTASRMESSGVVGQVNISESTYALLKDATYAEGSPLFRFTSRGKIQAKGKGELVMYLVEEMEADTVGLEERPLESTQA